MPYADKKAAFEYVNAYQKEKYDRITIMRTAGDKNALQAIAKQKGYKSTNDFLNSCIDEKLKRMKIDINDYKKSVPGPDDTD